jgi:hypothetical protein
MNCRIAGQISASKRVLRSKDEIALFELCSKHFIRVDHNVPLVGLWDADIIIYDTNTAVLWNGPWHRVQMPHKNHSLSQVQTRDRMKIAELQNAGWNVTVFEDDVWTPKTAFEKLVGDAGIEPKSDETVMSGRLYH